MTALQTERSPNQCRALLRPTVDAPRIARRLVREVGAGLPQRTVDNAALVAGELVLSSVVFARSTVEIELSVQDRALQICVSDHESVPPDMPQARFGRTNAVLSAASDGWGFQPTPTGRRVWAHVRI